MPSSLTRGDPSGPPCRQLLGQKRLQTPSCRKLRWRIQRSPTSLTRAPPNPHPTEAVGRYHLPHGFEAASTAGHPQNRPPAGARSSAIQKALTAGATAQSRPMSHENRQRCGTLRNCKVQFRQLPSTWQRRSKDRCSRMMCNKMASRVCDRCNDIGVRAVLERQRP